MKGRTHAAHHRWETTTKTPVGLPILQPSHHITPPHREHAKLIGRSVGRSVHPPHHPRARVASPMSVLVRGARAGRYPPSLCPFPRNIIVANLRKSAHQKTNPQRLPGPRGRSLPTLLQDPQWRCTTEKTLGRNKRSHKRSYRSEHITLSAGPPPAPSTKSKHDRPRPSPFVMVLAGPIESARRALPAEGDAHPPAPEREAVAPDTRLFTV